MVKPPKRRRRTQIFVRVTELEKAQILYAAQKLEMSLSEYLRHVLTIGGAKDTPQ